MSRRLLLWPVLRVQLVIIRGHLAEAMDYLGEIGGSAAMLKEEIAEDVSWLDQRLDERSATAPRIEAIERRMNRERSASSPHH